MPIPAHMLLLAGGADAAFTPTSIANCSLWLDATDAASITSSSGAVSQWDDKSGNSRHFAQTTAGNKPTTGTRTINSLNVIDFDGSDDYLGRVNDRIHNSSTGKWTVFVVALADTVAGLHAPISADIGASQVAQILRANGTALETIGFTTGGGSSSTDGAGATLSTATAYRFRSRNDAGGAGIEALVNSSGNGATSLASQRTETTTLLVGSGHGGTGSPNTYPWNGTIGEVICYSDALGTTDMASVESYLSTKWGI